MPSRVLFVGLNYSPEHTGIAPYTTGMAESLAEAGYEVEVITGLPHYPQWQIHDGYLGRAGTTEHSHGVTVHRVGHPVPSHGGLIHRLSMEVVFGLRAAMRGWNHPDLVVVVSPALFASVIVRLRAKFSRVPVVAWVQDIYTAGLTETASAGRLVTSVMERIEGSFLRSCQGVVVIHDRFTQYLGRVLNVDQTRIHVVRNWTHIGQPTRSDSVAVRERFGWNSDEVLVLHTGNMGAKQNLGNVAAAAAEAQRQGAPLRFVLVGGGRERPQLEELAGHTPRFDVLSSVDDQTYGALLTTADVLLVNERPGLKEMCVPSKLTSYFAAGRPVLAAVEAESPSAFEVSAADAGLRVGPGDPKALVEGALALHREWIESGGRRHDGGPRYVSEVLSRESATCKFRAALNAVMPRTRPDKSVARQQPTHEDTRTL